MAEIKIQRRQRSPWPWIIGIIILAGFIWFMLTYVYRPENEDNRVLSGDSTSTGNRYVPPADTTNEVREFIYYIRDTANTASPKKYTENGLIKLQSALSYIADRIDSTNNTIEENVDSLDRTVVKIDTSSNHYLGEIKPAFSAALDAMESIQKMNYPRLADNISKLRSTESSIDTNKSIGSQLNKIKQFFTEAGNMFHQMNSSYEYTLNKRDY